MKSIMKLSDILFKVFNEYYVIYPNALYVVPKEKEHIYERVYQTIYREGFTDYAACHKRAQEVLRNVFYEDKKKRFEGVL